MHMKNILPADDMHIIVETPDICKSNFSIETILRSDSMFDQDRF